MLDAEYGRGERHAVLKEMKLISTGQRHRCSDYSLSKAGQPPCSCAVAALGPQGAFPFWLCAALPPGRTPRCWEVCKFYVLEPEGYSWDSNLPSCLTGRCREMRLGTTKSVASDCPLLNESLSLSPHCAWVFAERQEMLRCVNPQHLGPPDLIKRCRASSWRQSHLLRALIQPLPRGIISVRTAGTTCTGRRL